MPMVDMLIFILASIDELLCTTSSQINSLFPLMEEAYAVISQLFPLSSGSQAFSTPVSNLTDQHQELLHLRKLGTLDAINVSHPCLRPSPCRICSLLLTFVDCKIFETINHFY